MSIGTILIVDPTGRLFLVEIEGGGHAVIEAVDRIEAEPGGKVRGNLEAEGHQEFLDLDGGQPFEAFGWSGVTTLPIAQRIMRGQHRK